MAQGSWLCTGFPLNDPSSVPLVFPPMAAALFICALLLAATRLSYKVWIYAGPLIVGLFFASSLLVDSLEIRMTFFGAPAVALVLTAVLLGSGLSYCESRRSAAAADGKGRKRRAWAGRAAAVVLSLAALLLTATLRDLHRLTIWANTLGDTGDLVGFSLFISILAATASGLMLSATLSERTKWAAVGYTLLATALMFAVSTRARRIDPYELTEKRAGRVVQAIKRYHALSGRYPGDLADLTPRHALWLLGPVVIYGQDWCYDGGDDYYRLGYVYREHWREPPTRLHFTAPIGRIYQARGEVPDLPGICEEEIAALQGVQGLSDGR
jgi:hypothetical protein